VKVVQRVPVKILLEPGQDPDRLLRPGMSVTPTIITK
jgi:membrane fusion protein (multidrug efflux system)